MNTTQFDSQVPIYLFSPTNVKNELNTKVSCKQQLIKTFYQVDISKHKQFQVDFQQSKDDQPSNDDDQEVAIQSEESGSNRHPNQNILIINQLSSRQDFKPRKQKKTTGVIPQPRKTIFHKLFHKKDFEAEQMVFKKANQSFSWFRNLKLSLNIHRFFQNLRSETRLLDLNSLTETQLIAINDKSDVRKGSLSESIHKKRFFKKTYTQQLSQGFFNLISTWVLFHLQSFYLYSETFIKSFLTNQIFFKPNTFWIVLWQLIQSMIILHNFIQFPLIKTFGKKVLSGDCENTRIIYFFELALLVLDIFVNCNVAIVDKGELVNQRGLIIWKYINKNQGLPFDLVCLLGFIIQKYSFLIQPCSQYMEDEFESVPVFILIIQCLFMLKVSKLKSILNRIEKNFHFTGQIKSYFKLFRLLLFIFLLAHIMACIWYLIAQFSISIYEENWLSQTTIQKSDWLYAYLYSLYYILMTMTTIGYGDIVPKNQIELAASLFIMVIIYKPIFGFTLNSINSILDELTKNTEKYKEKKRIIVDYMIKRGVSKELQMRVKNYFKTVYKNGMLDTMEQEELILDKLSLSLKEDLLFEDKGNILKKIPLISQNFSEKFIKRISQQVKEQHYSPGDIIDSREEKNFADNSLCYIYKGQVQLWSRGNQQKSKETFVKEGAKMIEEKHEEQYFGLENLFSGEELKLDIKSSDFTILYCLKYEDFISVISDGEHQDDYDMYCMLRDKLQLNYSVEDFNLKCYSCSSHFHQMQYCPQITYIPNKSLCLSKWIYNHKQERQSLENKRRKREKNSSLLKLKLIEDRLKAYQMSSHLFFIEFQYFQRIFVDKRGFLKYLSSLRSQLTKRGGKSQENLKDFDLGA